MVNQVSNFEISFVSPPNKKRPLTAAERARNMRARKRAAKVKKPPMTAAERVKLYRERKKLTKVKKIPMSAAERVRKCRARRKAARLTTVATVASQDTIDQFAIKSEIEYEQEDDHIPMQETQATLINANNLEVDNTNIKTELSDLIPNKNAPNSHLQEEQQKTRRLESMEMTNQVSNFEISYISQPENIAVEKKKRPMRARRKEAEERKKKERKPAMTATERTRKWRALKKATNNAIPFELVSSFNGVSVGLQNIEHEKQHVDELLIKASMEDVTISSEINEIESATSKELNSVWSTEINSEMEENVSEKPLEICTALFSESATKSAQANNEIMEKEACTKCNSKRGRRKTSRPMTQAERSKKHRAMKKARENAIPYELIALNETSDIMETVLTKDNTIAKVKVKFPLNSEERDTLYKQYAIIDEYIKSRKPKRRAMTAAERMRVYRQRKKEAQNKS